jgi:hypothetical protein
MQQQELDHMHSTEQIGHALRVVGTSWRSQQHNATFDIADFGGGKQTGVLRFLNCRADDRNLSGVVAGYRAVDKRQRVVGESGSGSTGEVVVWPSDRARARPGQIRSVRKNLEEHIGGMIQAMAVTVGRGIAEETVETSEGVEGGVVEFAGEGAGSR